MFCKAENSVDTISDVWDTAHINQDFFKDTQNIALSFCTDGVPIFKSSRTEIWPVYYSILNLPASIRTKAKNIIMSGLWIGAGKPSFPHLLEPLLAEINHLTTVGIQIDLPTGIVTVKAKLVLGVFDLPAKASILSFKHHNGYCSCSVYLHPGKHVSKNTVVFTPTETIIRTHDQTISFGQEAIECGKPVKGVKCISPLADYLDLVDCIPVEYMHAVLEGITGRLMKLWFEPNRLRKPYYLRKKMKTIDSLLMKQTPPDDFSRAPRCIANHRKYWKATELKQWLLYYSLPLLKNKLPPLYWHHFSLLVSSMHILLKDKITLNEFDAADIMIKDFLTLFPTLYGEINCVHNLHILSHLTRYVRLWGPLWTHSTFCFENKNGLIKRLFHGTNDIGQQILFNLSAQCTVHSLLYDIKLSDGDIVAGYIAGYNFRSNMMKITEHIYAVGKIELRTLTNVQQDALHHRDSDRAEVFYRLHKFGVMYHCTQYTRQTRSKRNNTFCQFQCRRSGTNNFGEIILFVRYPKPCALIKDLVPSSPTLSRQAGFAKHPKLKKHQRVDMLNCIMPSVSRGQLACIDLADITKKAVLMKVDSKEYICAIPNSYELH